MPGADIVYGSTTFTSALIDISQPEGHTPENYSKSASGFFRTLAGVCKETTALKPLAAPLGLYAGMFSFAGGAFKEGNRILGYVTLFLGNALNIILLIPIKAALKISLTAFGVKSAAVAAKLSLTIVGAVAGLAILASVAVIIADTLKSEPPMPAPVGFAQGGFPVTGRPFIAREAGPELVGRLNGSTAVVSNDQIVEAVSRGVYGAFRSALCDRNSESPLIARVFFDGKEIAMAGQV